MKNLIFNESLTKKFENKYIKKAINKTKDQLAQKRENKFGFRSLPSKSEVNILKERL